MESAFVYLMIAFITLGIIGGVFKIYDGLKIIRNRF